MISNAFSAVHVKLCAWTGSCRGSRPRFVGLKFFVWCFAISRLACIPVALVVTCDPVVGRDCRVLVICDSSWGGTNLLVIMVNQINVDSLRRAMGAMLILC